MLDLIQLFGSLQSPEEATEEEAIRFSAISIPGYSKHRLAKDAQDKPCLLISVLDSSRKDKSAPIKLEHVFVQYDVKCQISQIDGVIEEGKFTIVGCAVNDETMHTYFLHIASILVTALGTDPSRNEVFNTINNFIELFRGITEIPRKSVQGLWAELFLMARANDIPTVIKAWHPTNEDRYDFSSEDQRIEVKSTSKRTRQHYFSLEQLCPPANTNLVIASIFVEYAGIGTSIMDLVDHINTHLASHPDLMFKLDRLISSTLGTNWRDAFDAQFDIDLAEESLKFFEVTAIPTVNRDIPAEVSEVHFKSDLSNCPSLDLQHFRKQGGLFKATLSQQRFKTIRHKHIKVNS
ncbi:PD-(D/E)XK motif protein [Dictyobacter aurantiacus]|uniref:PD-(D/E)XK motif protein n=1 Tax=Dictyobacter aurantiacus TaxID=1936993 RepID=A0A401ZFU4_9CHLR|nr:PD-(D/E)XK motif protein [Dictyobacter aurantiacus]GCE05751.1 hypothetical protein KDAU_30800 [Dictyobacter aurantiacus]